MKFSLVQNWSDVLKFAWSWRLNILAAILAAFEAGSTYYTSGQVPVIATLVAIGSLGAAIARIISQSNMPHASEEGIDAVVRAFLGAKEEYEKAILTLQKAQEAEVPSPSALRTMAKEGGALG